ncbi:xylulokinase [Neotabrizicola sp. VNH66]|uniref:xylulokinase n=1 Tax=Neotabrizicola sp. VNH66 TaxID=3400918 RepID=UPI003C11BC69
MLLALDIGTGSVRAGLVDGRGRVLARAARSHATHLPRHGWVEQAPADWWAGTVAVVRQVLAETGRTVSAVVACGQMHAPVLLDRSGAVVQARVPLWNDKRAAAEVAALQAQPLPGAVNPPTTAWPGIKLNWLARHDPAALARAATLLMPKDYINFRLTGARAMDWSEAGSSFLSDPAARNWSPVMAARLQVPEALLPPLLRSDLVLGPVTDAAAAETGLPAGTPVLVGAGDFPCALLGAGLSEPGEVCDVTGTSFLLTRVVAEPVRHPQVMNVALPLRHWGAFAVVDAAGDAVRWAARSLDRDRSGLEALTAEATAVAPGSDGLMFLPYLTGERLGAGVASKAGFVGLTAGHGPAHLQRAVLEGVVLAMAEAFAPVIAATGPPDRIIATAGGARSAVWLQIKADVFGVPVIPTEEAECGLIGAAVLGHAALGRFASPEEAARAMVRHRPPVLPRPEHRPRHEALVARFARIRRLMAAVNQTLSETLP